MKEIQLSRGYISLVDDEDYERVNAFPWCATSAPGSTCYGWNNSLGLLHRFIISAKKGETCDHIDGDGLNNSRSNIRIVSKSVNGIKRVSFSRNTTGYRGVYLYRDGKYKAEIMCQRQKYHLGTFISAEAASIAYDMAAIKLFGKDAPKSKISDGPLPKPLQKLNITFHDLFPQQEKS